MIKRWGKAGEILTIWYFWLTCEKVGSGFQYHHGGVRMSLSHSLSTRLIPAYGFGVIWLSVQPNRCTFLQSRAQAREKSKPVLVGTRKTVDLGSWASAPPFICSFPIILYTCIVVNAKSDVFSLGTVTLALDNRAVL